jgi:CO/xanthine dehydrogenase Mo-binding subunit
LAPHPISEPVVKKDHDLKMSGRALYAADHYPEGLLFAAALRSPHARARILKVTPPELPPGHIYADHRDIPGPNEIPIVNCDTPVLAVDAVQYVGEPILVMAGPDERAVRKLLSRVRVDYEVLEPELDVKTAGTTYCDYNFGRGDVDKAMAEADKTYDEEFETFYQEQAYIEPQGLVVRWEEGKIIARGSMQCPYYVHEALVHAFALPEDKVRVVQDVTGGGFGGKEDFPSNLACLAALCAMKAGGRPVGLFLGRAEDMECSTKRHPSVSRYRAAVKNGRLTALDIDVVFNAGAYTTLTGVVLLRGVASCVGVYKVDNLRVRGRGVKTNTVPCGAYRGFGAPQTVFAVEMFMGHIAGDLGLDPLDFKIAHLAAQGDLTSTSGRYHHPVPLPAMIEDAVKNSGYREKRELCKRQDGRLRRGVGLSLWFHGAGFAGTGERDFIKARVRLVKSADGRVEALASNTDIGQGLKTTFAKIVAHELGIPLDRVTACSPDTDRCPNSGPTVASRSIMTVGELFRRAAVKLREGWADGVEQVFEDDYVQPDYIIPYDYDRCRGDAYATYSWAACVVELEVDLLTGVHRVLGVWGCFDAGTPVDRTILTGQMEGGLLQGIGYSSMEQMKYDRAGRIRNKTFSDYLIPTAMDVPLIKVTLHVEKFPEGPYGAKGAGELPLPGVPAAYLSALEQAMGGIPVRHAPFSAEETLAAVMEAGK